MGTKEQLRDQAFYRLAPPTGHSVVRKHIQRTVSDLSKFGDQSALTDQAISGRMEHITGVNNSLNQKLAGTENQGWMNAHHETRITNLVGLANDRLIGHQQESHLRNTETSAGKNLQPEIDLPE
ncbi:hypothetical protein N8564_02985 [Verrucomicrobiales bacterium]|nr:hypothetical protein [Verrucomicrobiales bacterium]